ncbi:hypothetical protein [Curtobacterium sp. 24E2]|nr:hypothetical protein JN350_07420 [Curtobacterium sp. 24E2]
MEAMQEGLAAITAAVEDFKARVSARDEAVKTWGRTLRSLGVPDTGLTVDGLDVAITRNGQITIGDRTVNLTGEWTRGSSARCPHVSVPHGFQPIRSTPSTDARAAPTSR